MRLERKLFLALGATLVAGACATAGGGAPAGAFPVVACPEGVVVAPAREAVEAQKAFVLGRTEEALTQAQAAVAAGPENPQHYYLLGQVQIAAGNFAEAEAAFERAVGICPAFAAEVEPELQRGWKVAFDRGLEAYEAGDTAAAVALWEAANLLYTGVPDAYYNLGVVYIQRGELQRGVEAYREALNILERMPADTVAAEIQARAETRQNVMAGLLSAGAQLFQQEQFQDAAELFDFLTGVNPNNRDAWYNYALALFKLQRWDDLVPVAQRLVELDPLNENARIILFNAYKGLAEAAEGPREEELRNQALRTLEEIESLPVYVEDVRFEAPAEGAPTVTGQVVGNAATAGQQVALNFTFYGPDGVAGTETVTVAAPAKGEAAAFQAPLPAGIITSYSYGYSVQ